LLAAVAGGIAGAAAVVAGLWLSGVLQPTKSANDLNSRISALETQAKAPPKANDNQALTDLSARIGKLEQAPKATVPASDSALTDR
jgi:hypothetical protein